MLDVIHGNSHEQISIIIIIFKRLPNCLQRGKHLHCFLVELYCNIFLRKFLKTGKLKVMSPSV